MLKHHDAMSDDQSRSYLLARDFRASGASLARARDIPQSYLLVIREPRAIAISVLLVCRAIK